MSRPAGVGLQIKAEPRGFCEKRRLVLEHGLQVDLGIARKRFDHAEHLWLQPRITPLVLPHQKIPPLSL